MSTAARVRILLIAPSLDILGGQAVQATRLLAGLRKEDWLHIDFQPINPRFPGPFQWLEKVKYLRTVVRRVMYLAQILTRIPKYDIVHAFSAGNTSFSLWTVPAMQVSRWAGKKFILNYRDGQAGDHLQRFKKAKSQILQATVVVSPSDFVVETFKENGIPARRIYNIIDLSPFKYRQRSQLKPVFMTNRILEQLYNVPCILRAFAIIQKRYPEASLTIAHDGNCRPALEQLAQELGLKNTKFVGRVPHNNIAALYDATDIYLTTPNFDCMPGSLLECFASGVPVIATNVGGIPYILTDEQTGLLVEPDDHEGVAARALLLLEEPALVERITRHARESLEQYRWEQVRDNWLNVYRELSDMSIPPVETKDPAILAP